MNKYIYLIIFFAVLIFISDGYKSKQEKNVTSKKVIPDSMRAKKQESATTRLAKEATSKIKSNYYFINNHHASSKNTIKKLLDEQISNQERQAINEQLKNKRSVYNATGSVETSGAREISIGLIDQNGNAIVYRATEPLPMIEK